MRTTLSWGIVLLFVSIFVQTGVASGVNQESGSGDVIITVDSTNLRFSPDTVTVTEGDTVRFFWNGQALPHNAVETNELFDSGDPQRDVDYSFTFEVGMNGTYDFVCEPHAAFGMVGQIIVEPAPMNQENNTNNTNVTDSPEMEDKMLPSLSIPFTLASLAVGACVQNRRIQ
ncbi:MAG: plastocyanin/azurin family copper-binding protein [Candidatus Thalassarchaeaceae archaeon]|nr:plastocyanin/azurin family copper-binding protein [Candidatus Thalassarchaeaceae archaeon]